MRSPGPASSFEQLTLPDVELSVSHSALVPARKQRIYCNRSIRLDQIEWIGFDMDYTLAIYDQPKMDQLTIDAALQKLRTKGYPESLLNLKFELDFPVRGLLLDAKLGNVIKMDRYKYVKRAYHGMRELGYDERRTLYHASRLRTKRSSRYHFIDTLYALSEVTLFAAGVQHMESLGMQVDYAKWFADIRETVDLSHQDGSILEAIVQNPAHYIQRDPDLPLTLHKLRSAGKKLFLLTNSQPAYTDRIMRYLLEGSLPEYKSWMHMFDIVITASKKPRFFIEEDVPFLSTAGKPVSKLERGKMYVGGCSEELARITKINDDRVLYVGDHIYGDVLRAKRHSAWRTAMIIQELEEELSGVARTSEASDRWDRLEEARQALSDELNHVQETLRTREKRKSKNKADTPEDSAERLRLRRRIERVRAKIKMVDHECAQLENEIESQFHRYWGPLLKAGAEPSSFGHQVEAYACLYTGKVSNLLAYSPMHYFRSPRERLPHEL
ncbi:MAG: HAD-IG family 5'-nucleotidase [Myxococcales bacterium]